MHRISTFLIPFLFCCSWVLGQAPEPTTADAELEKIAERFFLNIIDRKEAALLKDIEMTDAMRKWVQSGGSKKVGIDIERLFGGLGECRKKEIVPHGEKSRSVEMFYSGKTESFMIRVTFDGTKISGIHVLSWIDEQRQVGTPIRLETTTGTIFGSVVEPESKTSEAVPVVLILAGSGPTDRNGNQPPMLMCNAYRMLAEALQRAESRPLRTMARVWIWRRKRNREHDGKKQLG